MENKENMLGKILGKIVGLPLEVLRVLYDLVEKLAGGEWREWLAELKKFLRKEKCWTGVAIETLLELLGEAVVSMRIGKFVAKDHFVKDTSKKAKVKISYLGDIFKDNFLGKVEEVTTKITTLSYRKLKKASRDIPIINELGGEDKAETTLAEMFVLMEMHGNGASGTLLTNGYANIFYIRDVNGVLWAVDCDWYGDGWYVYAYSVDDPDGWRAGRQVFSRNSSETKS